MEVSSTSLHSALVMLSWVPTGPWSKATPRQPRFTLHFCVMASRSTFSIQVFRVEGEGIFLTKRGAVQTGANSRIFAGPGGSVIESPNIIKLIVPPEEEEKPVRFKQPAVLCLNIGDASRAETYYAQKLLQYREAAEKLRTEASTSSGKPSTAFLLIWFTNVPSIASYHIQIPHQVFPYPHGRR